MSSLAVRVGPAEARLARRAALAVLGAALLAGSAYLRVPMWPAPMTMQTFVVMLLGAAYAPSLAGASVAVYLALGAAGYGVFAGGVGGAAILTGPTGGYLAGFLLAALAIAALMRRGWDRTYLGAAGALLIGDLVIYACGLGWLSWLLAAEKGFGWVLDKGLVVFLPGDLLKLALAALLAPALRRVLPR